MVEGNKIVEKVEIEDFIELVRRYSSEQIECTNHTFFRLSEEQRKVFKCDNLKEYILYENPIRVGMQKNKNYAVFYKYNKKVMRMIIDVQMSKINIVTFYFIEQNQIPRI